MRVAYFSPLPPERSGIADYSALLLPALRRRLDVVAVKRNAKRPPRGVEASLYHVGNDPEAHGWILAALERKAGVVVLHELVLHHLVAGLTLARGDVGGYLRALERDAGVVGRLLGHGVVDRTIQPLWETRPEEYPLTSFLLERAQGLVVHSRYVERGARAMGFAGPIWRIPHPAWPVPAELAPAGLPPDRSPVIGFFGHLNQSKRIPQLLQAFARVRESHPQALLLLVGSVAARFELDARLERLGLVAGRDLLQLGYVDEPRLWALMAATDVCVNLRSPTMGETSGTAIRALSLGKPLVVSDRGWFSELPDSVAAKVPLDEWEAETLAATLDLILRDGALREEMGAAARRLAEGEHDLERVAELYAAALEQAAGGGRVSEAALAEVAAAAGQVGLFADSPELDWLVERLQEAIR